MRVPKFFLAGISTHLAHPAPLMKHQRVLAGQLKDAEPLHADWMAAWHTFGGLPELFDAGLAMRHPLQRACPLFVSEHAGTCFACRRTLCTRVEHSSANSRLLLHVMHVHQKPAML